MLSVVMLNVIILNVEAPLVFVSISSILKMLELYIDIRSFSPIAPSSLSSLNPAYSICGLYYKYSTVVKVRLSLQHTL
jgi:hypothetical protein